MNLVANDEANDALDGAPEPSRIEMANDFRSLVATSFPKAEAAAYEKYLPSQSERGLLVATGIDLLKHFPVIPGACMLVSAVHACMLEEKVGHRAYVAIGSL